MAENTIVVSVGVCSSVSVGGSLCAVPRGLGGRER